MHQPKIAVIGLGYVGLPVAIEFARRYPGTLGFDINQKRIAALTNRHDETGEVSSTDLGAVELKLTCDKEALRECNFFVVAVPTPIDRDKRPDMRALVSASRLVGSVMSAGSTVVYESTVYPGVTEEICGPELAAASNLRQGIDFKLGYSPERINPGDREHTLTNIVKVVSGEDDATLDLVASVYGSIVRAGIHRAPSIKVAEAAKVIENTQRDLNIALMNELSLIFDRLGISTKAVLEAAATKWNFLKFAPGLVGGHCIGVDPYYLTTKAEQLGYRPLVILAGRRINDGMGQHIAQRTVKLMIHSGRSVLGARVGILGLTFKENVSDIRNSRVPDIVAELSAFGIVPLVHDPLANHEEVTEEYGIELAELDTMRDLDAIILAVSHDAYAKLPPSELISWLRSDGVLVDIKSILDPSAFRGTGIKYWSL